jgi:hypothetical protein
VTFVLFVVISFLITKDTKHTKREPALSEAEGPKHEPNVFTIPSAPIEIRSVAADHREIQRFFIP